MQEILVTTATAEGRDLARFSWSGNRMLHEYVAQLIVSCPDKVCSRIVDVDESEFHISLLFDLEDILDLRDAVVDSEWVIFSSCYKMIEEYQERDDIQATDLFWYIENNLDDYLYNIHQRARILQMCSWAMEKLSNGTGVEISAYYKGS